MAQLSRVMAAAIALLTIAALGACGDSSEQPGSTSTDSVTEQPRPESDPVDLINMWRVTGAQGEEDPAWLRLDAGGFMLWRDCGYLMGSWRATATMFAAYTYGATGGCAGDGVPQADWLHAVEGYRPAGDDWELLDGQRSVVATLTVDGSPDPIPDSAASHAEAPVITDNVREALSLPEPLPEASIPATGADLLGRWVPQEVAPTDPFAEFDDDGTWSGSDGCNGASGRWLVGEDGELIATVGPTTLVGCEGANVPSWVAGASTAAIEGNTLLLYDRDGGLLAELVHD